MESEKAVIAAENNGSFNFINCEYGSDVKSIVDRLQLVYLPDPAKTERLLALGDIVCLGSTPDIPSGCTALDFQGEDVTFALHRDKGEKYSKARHAASMNELKKNLAEECCPGYAYIIHREKVECLQVKKVKDGCTFETLEVSCCEKPEMQYTSSVSGGVNGTAVQNRKEQKKESSCSEPSENYGQGVLNF
jgi:hypothetical protein